MCVYMCAPIVHIQWGHMESIGSIKQNGMVIVIFNISMVKLVSLDAVTNYMYQIN